MRAFVFIFMGRRTHLCFLFASILNLDICWLSTSVEYSETWVRYYEDVALIRGSIFSRGNCENSVYNGTGN
jgi:hypothetical protein